MSAEFRIGVGYAVKCRGQFFPEKLGPWSPDLQDANLFNKENAERAAAECGGEALRVEEWVPHDNHKARPRRKVVPLRPVGKE